MTEITINGKQFPVVFNMNAMMKFEEVINDSFFTANLYTLKNKIALIVSAVVEANPNAAITEDDLIGDKTIEEITEIIKAANIVLGLVAEYLHLPDVVANADDEVDDQPQEGDQVKN